MRRRAPAVWLAVFALALTGLALQPVGSAPTAAADTTAGERPFPGADGQPHEVTWDQHSFKVDGERLNVYSGEFHYWRLPSPEDWRDVLQKIKAAGHNAVSFYFFWGYHSSAPGQYDFTGIRDIDRLMTMAAEEGLYIIARPGPYINAEVSMGGFPAYMTNTPDGLRPANARNLDLSKEWLHQFNQIAKRHRVTDGGGALLMYQVENELPEENAQYVALARELVAQVKADGITVPIFHNDHNLGFRFVPASQGGTGPGRDVGFEFYTYDTYPMGFTCNAGRSQIADTESQFRSRITDSPVFIAEGQGGAFTPWGAPFNTDACADYVDGNFVRQWGLNNMGQGVTAFNYYMTFGGTNWGWTGSPASGFTSYDYGAAIDENRQLTAKYHTQKQLGYMIDTLDQLASSDRVAAPSLTIDGLGVTALARQDREELTTRSVTGNGAQFIALRHTNSNDTGTTRVSFPLSLDLKDGQGNVAFTADDTDPAGQLRRHVGVCQRPGVDRRELPRYRDVLRHPRRPRRVHLHRRRHRGDHAAVHQPRHR